MHQQDVVYCSCVDTLASAGRLLLQSRLQTHYKVMTSAVGYRQGVVWLCATVAEWALHLRTGL